MASRAKITDAASGARGLRDAEHGTDDVAAITTLDDILTRMATHESKKTSLLRQLRAWRPRSADLIRGAATRLLRSRAPASPIACPTPRWRSCISPTPRPWPSAEPIAIRAYAPQAIAPTRYRFFRHFGGVVRESAHLFADGVDAAAHEAALKTWLDGLHA